MAWTAGSSRECCLSAGRRQSGGQRNCTSAVSCQAVAPACTGTKPRRTVDATKKAYLRIAQFPQGLIARLMRCREAPLFAGQDEPRPQRLSD